MVVINLMVYINPFIAKRMFPINDYAIILKILQFCSFFQMILMYLYSFENGIFCVFLTSHLTNP